LKDVLNETLTFEVRRDNKRYTESYKKALKSELPEKIEESTKIGIQRGPKNHTKATLFSILFFDIPSV